jgi:DNA polymerase III subunit delta
MKVARRDVARFLRSAEQTTAAVLLYGPDLGLVNERARELVTRIAGDPGDPFRVAELSAAQLKEDPRRLADEADALSLSGGRRILRLRQAGDALTSLLADLLKGRSPAAFLVLEAGELSARSSLRALFERLPNAAAIACYLDDETALRQVIGEWLASQHLSAEPEALGYLIAHLGNDRGVSRQELDKLALYVGRDAPRVTLGDVQAVIGDSSSLTLEDLAFAVGDGDGEALERCYARALAEGSEEVAILRAVARHFLRLHQVASASDPGAAIRALRPTVFFKLEARFLAQLRLWAPAALGDALDRLIRTETLIKTNLRPKSALAERALLDLASLVRQAPRRFSRPG